MENKENNPTKSASDHEEAARLLCLKALMQIRRIKKQLTLDALAKRDAAERAAASAVTIPHLKTHDPSGYRKGPRNKYQLADRYDIARTKHMRSKFRRSFR